MVASTYFGEDTTLKLNASVMGSLVSRSVGQIQLLTGSLPPSSLVLLSSLAVQCGAVLTKSLFEVMGTHSAVFLCKAIAAIFLVSLWRPRLKGHSVQDYIWAGLLGFTMAAMSLCIYSAIARLPLGIASTLEFMGPLGVAILGSRQRCDWLWVGLAAMGVALLAPIQNSHLDMVGVGFALLAAVFWGAYILFSVPTGKAFPGGSGLAIATTIAALFMLPFGATQVDNILAQPGLVFVACAAALLGTVVPYSMEYKALKTLPPRVFGVLISIEPAIAALVGFLLLGEHLGMQDWLAITLVVSAAIGATLSKPTP
jgi:inner membrane transporter RhtA